MAHKRVSQVEMATSFSKIYPCMAHKRVSQLGMATSLSKFYPPVAHQRVSQLGMTLPFLNSTLPTKGRVKLKWQLLFTILPSGGSPKGESTWKGNILL